MALNNYGRQLIDFEPLIRQTIDQTESDDLYDYVQSSLSSNFTSLGARVMAKMKISFSYASLSGLTPFFYFIWRFKTKKQSKRIGICILFQNRNLKAEGFILVQKMNRS